MLVIPQCQSGLALKQTGPLSNNGQFGHEITSVRDETLAREKQTRWNRRSMLASFQYGTVTYISDPRKRLGQAQMICSLISLCQGGAGLARALIMHYGDGVKPHCQCGHMTYGTCRNAMRRKRHSNNRGLVLGL